MGRPDPEERAAETVTKCYRGCLGTRWSGRRPLGTRHEHTCRRCKVGELVTVDGWCD
uniref:Uncharacterized protein n=1 Tax=Arundo donax TaxID=35708 RepID=A0A0A9GJD0_ARUDO